MKKEVAAADITDIELTQAGYYWEMGYNIFDFTCKINGENDVLHMREQRHDDGTSFVIRSEKMTSGRGWQEQKLSSLTISCRKQYSTEIIT